MSKTYYATGNIKHDDVKYAKGDEILDLSEKQAESLLSSGAISTEKIEDEVSEGEDLIQSPEEKAKARKDKGQESQESKDKSRDLKVGGEAQDSGEPSVDSDEGNGGSSDENDSSQEDSTTDSEVKSKYKVLRGLEYPRGTVHEVDAELELTEDEANGFAVGSIEKVEQKEGGFLNKILGSGKKEESPSSNL